MVYNLFQLADMAVHVLVEVEYLMEYDYCCYYCWKFHHLLNQSLIHCVHFSNSRGFDAQPHVRVVYSINSSCLNYAYDNSVEIWKKEKNGMEIIIFFSGFLFCGFFSVVNKLGMLRELLILSIFRGFSCLFVYIEFLIGWSQDGRGLNLLRDWNLCRNFFRHPSSPDRLDP